MRDTLSPEWFGARFTDAKNRAGKRFTENLDVTLPLARYFAALTQAVSWFDEFAKAAERLNDVWRRPIFRSSQSDDDLRRFAALMPDIITSVQTLAARKAEAPVSLPVGSVATRIQEALSAIATPFGTALERARGAATPQEKTIANDRVEALIAVRNELEESVALLASDMAQSTNNPLLLLLGAAGTGKTHLLCEMTKERLDEGTPALLFLAQAFQAPFTGVLQQLCASIGWSGRSEDFYSSLDDIARRNQTRCLICIDAINEGHRESWKNAVEQLTELSHRYTGIALVVSCRTPFEKVLVPDLVASKFIVVNHYGYPPELQSNAIETYFKGYRIPLPEVPLYEEEFSNPLFLRLFCEALEKVTTKGKHKQIHQIAAGQKGMTHVLEYFVDQKDRSLAKQLGTPVGFSWNVLKAAAKFMASNHTSYVPLADAARIVDALQPAALQPGSFLRALINEDILAEDVLFNPQSEAVEVVRPTYQKFADHLISRYLLDEQLDTSSKRAIKQSLRDSNLLGFFLKNTDAALENINIVQALLIEFPTRIGNRGEIFDYLDWNKIPIRVCEAFIEGLYWRDPKSINKQTAHWVLRFLAYGGTRDSTLNVLVALAAKPKHPFDIARLSKYLRASNLVERDLTWGEYIRKKSQEQGTPIRVLAWAEHSAEKQPSSEFAATYIALLQWFLTSTKRPFRDRATHALFTLGMLHPAILFHETTESLSINDPYVWTRMLAASYGVAMALWAVPGQITFQQRTLAQYARRLVKLMFRRGAKYGTTHVLARDYASRTIQLALKIHPQLLTPEQRRLTARPFSVGGIRTWGEAEDRDEGKYRQGDAPLGMDFRNYTLGRLVLGRSAYDDDHLGYQTVLRQIMWRIYDLGYTLEQFSSIDQAIAQSSWREQDEGRRTDRYGKKYAWIAFYELAGYQQDLGILPHDDERISDADIDPSFPTIPSSPRLFPQTWVQHQGSLEDWIRNGAQPDIEADLIIDEFCGQRGPWVVFRASVDQGREDKTIFAFFQSLLVAPRDIDHAVEILSARPGNPGIPLPEEEHYTYAGEVPWCETWRTQQYEATISSGGKTVSLSPSVRFYAWESYHSTENLVGTVYFPSKELAEHLNLYVQIPYTKMAVRNSDQSATIFVKNGSDFYDSEMVLLFRQDLLDRYLADLDLRLLLLVWGERRPNLSRKNLRDLEESMPTIRYSVHRQAFMYKNGRFRRFL